MNWQTIDTAPKDGRAILVADGIHRYGIVIWDDEEGWIDYHDGLRAKIKPTHWAPLEQP